MLYSDLSIYLCDWDERVTVLRLFTLIELELGDARTNSGASFVSKCPCVCTSLCQVRRRSTMPRVWNRVQRQQCRHESHD